MKSSWRREAAELGGGAIDIPSLERGGGYERLRAFLRRRLIRLEEGRSPFAQRPRPAQWLANIEATCLEIFDRPWSRADPLARLGRALARRRGSDDGVWRRIVEAESKAGAAAFRLARALHRAARYGPAAEQYLRVLALDPSEERSLSALDQLCNRLARQRGEEGDAARIRGELEALAPGSPRARQNAEAIAGAADALLSEGGLDTRALSQRALLFWSRREPPEAIAALSSLAAARPDLLDARELLARMLLRQGQFVAAASIYEELARLRDVPPRLFEALERLYRRLRDWEAACRVLGEIVERDPRRTSSRFLYGHALQRAGSLAEAERQFEAVLAIRPYDADALAMLGRIRSKTDPEGALDCWSRLARLKPHTVEPPLQMARIRARQGRAAEAQRLFQIVLDRSPDHAEALAGFGHALADEDRDEAIRHFLLWAERRPGDARPRLELARLHQKAKDWDRAETIYREILERDPKNEVAALSFAELLSRDPSRIEEALELWRQIAEGDPSAAFPLVERAHLLRRLGRFDAAEAQYRAALALSPDNVPAQSGLARSLSRREAAQGALEEALALYERVLAAEPAHAGARLQRGRLLRRLGRVEEAIEAWRMVCARAPRNAEAWHELVFMLASAERDAEALAALEAAEAALPNGAQTLIRLGRAAAAAQFHESAVQYFERAIASEPRVPSHRAGLGVHYFREGILDGAFHNLLAARELDPADVHVAGRLVATIHILQDLGIDPIQLRKGQQRIGEILVPERSFGLIRRIAEEEVTPYDPVPRRVIAVSASLAPGGSERQLVTLLRELSEREFGLDLSLFCLSLSKLGRRDFFLPLLSGLPIEIFTPARGVIEAYLRQPEAAPYARLIRHFPEDMAGPIAFCLAEFRRRRPEVVHAWQDGTNLTAVAAALLAGVPRIILSTRSMRPDNPRRRLKRFMKEAYEAVLRHPSVVLVNNSLAGARDYAEWLGLDPARIAVVYNGIDFDRLKESAQPAETRRARESLRVPPQAPVVGSVFRMSEEKRPLLWVETAAEIARRLPPAHFILCGEGPMKKEMMELAARLGIADRLHLAGPQDNIALWLKAMDVVMLTSRHEGLPNVLIEAQSLGLPVVAPDVGGMSETIRQGVTGWTIPDADAAALAERVLYCLGEEAWRESAREAGPSFVRERFAVGAMLRRMLEVYGVAGRGALLDAE